MFWHCAAHVKHHLHICRVTAISPGAVQTEFSNIRFKVGQLCIHRYAIPALHIHTLQQAMLLTGVRRLSKAVLMCHLCKQGNQEAADAVYSGIQPLTAGEHHNV